MRRYVVDSIVSTPSTHRFPTPGLFCVPQPVHPKTTRSYGFFVGSTLPAEIRFGSSRYTGPGRCLVNGGSGPTEPETCDVPYMFIHALEAWSISISCPIEISWDLVELHLHFLTNCQFSQNSSGCGWFRVDLQILRFSIRWHHFRQLKKPCNYGQKEENPLHRIG